MLRKINVRLFIAVAATAFLAACGGGDDSPLNRAGPQQLTTAPASASAIAQAAVVGAPTLQCTCVPKQVRITLTGDSTMEGDTWLNGIATIANPAPGQIVQAEMDRLFGKGAVVVTNIGSGGAQSKDQISGKFGKFKLPWPGDVLGSDIVLNNIGVNDFTHHVPLATFAANLRLLADAGPGVQVVWQTQSPMPGKWGLPMGDYAQAMRDVAGTGPVAEVWRYVQTITGWEKLVSDTEHPGQALYELEFKNVTVPALTPYVARLRCQGGTPSPTLPTVALAATRVQAQAQPRTAPTPVKTQPLQPPSHRPAPITIQPPPRT